MKSTDRSSSHKRRHQQQEEEKKEIEKNGLEGRQQNSKVGSSRHVLLLLHLRPLLHLLHLLLHLLHLQRHRWVQIRYTPVLITPARNT